MLTPKNKEYERGVQDGILAERKRREQLLAFKGQNFAVDLCVEHLIASGETYEEGLQQIARAAVFSGPGENAPDIATKSPDTASGVSVLSAEDIEAARLAGMSLADYRRYRLKPEPEK